MIEPNDRDPQVQNTLELRGKLKNLSTTEIDWGSKVAYDITIRTLDPQALAIAALKAGTILNVKVELTNEPQRANSQKARR